MVDRRPTATADGVSALAVVRDPSSRRQCASACGATQTATAHFFHEKATQPTVLAPVMAPPRHCRLCASLLFSALAIPVAVGAAGPPINLNIRRAAAPTDSHGSTNTDDAGPDTSTVAGRGQSTKQWGGVSLDLTGEFSCLVSSPDGGESSGGSEDKIPLFRLGSNRNQGRRVPSVHIGGRYDFSRAWYGVTRVFGSLSWHGQRVAGMAANGEVESAGSSSTTITTLQRMKDNWSRCTMTLRAEKDILIPNDNAIQFSLKKRLDSNNEPYQSIPPSLTLRVDSGVAGDSASVAIRTPIHPRLDIVSKTTVMLDFDEHNDLDGIGPIIKQRESFASRVPKVLSREDWETGSWLPDIKLSPTGWLAARTEAGIPPISAPSGNKSGIRLSVNRQVPWSMWGAHDDDEIEESNTWIRLEVCGTSENNFYSASVDAALERLVNSLRITLAHEKVAELPTR